MPRWSLCVAPDRAISETVDFCNSLIIMRQPWPDNSNRGGSLTSEEGVCANWLIPILRCWGRKPPAKKLTEVNGDAVEEEVSIASSIVDGDKALEVLVECFC